MRPKAGTDGLRRPPSITVWLVVLSGILITQALTPIMAAGEAGVTPPAPKYVSHAPILIKGNPGFRAENGVRGGSGILGDPYRIEGWEIAFPHGPSGGAINIIDTDAFFEIRDVEVHSPGSIGIYLNNVTNGRISGMRATENSFAISAWRVRQVTISGNNLSGNLNGLLIAHSADINVSGNVVSENAGQGIQVLGSKNVTISENVASNNGDMGITSLDCDSLRIVGNIVSSNMNDGIGLRTPFRVTKVGDIIVIANTVTDNDWGVFAARLTNTSILDNFVARNRVGISLGSYGLVAHNTVVESALHAVSPVGIGNGTWSRGYPEGGNYWSDYAGTDRCSGPLQNACTAPDGIGDTPYPINGGPQDGYPLMRPRNTLPIASLNVSPLAGDIATEFVFDAIPSPGVGTPVETLLVRWDWEGDGRWDTEWAEGKTARHVYEQPGTYTVRLDIKNPAGLRSTAGNRIEVSPDLTKPIVTILSPSDGAILSSRSAEIAGTAADNAAIERVELSVDSENWTLANGTYDWSGFVSLTEGPNVVYVRAVDASGNEVTVAIHVTVEIATAALGGSALEWSVAIASALAALVVGLVIAVRLRRRRKP